MINDSDLLKDIWPRWTWGKSDWWFTAISTTIALILLFVSLSSDVSFNVRLSVLGLGLLLPILWRGIPYVLTVSKVALLKMLLYDRLYRLYGLKNRELEQTRETIINVVRQFGIQQLPIHKVIYFKQQMNLEFKKKRGVTLEVGQKLEVLDTQDGNLMGRFEVSEVRDKEYLAKISGYVSPLWLGYVQQNPNGGEYSAPPNTIAILAQREEVNE